MDDCPTGFLCYEFGDYRLDAARRVIRTRDGGRRLVVPPKAFDAAVYLVQHPGRVLSKQEMLAALWPGLVVEENGLTQVISVLRSALGETRGDNRYIVTVPRRGYCFVAAVLRVATSVDTPLTQGCTVAVLPFDNVSELASDASLATGLAEGILHRLANTAGIRLVAQTSSFTFRGRKLDVREVGRVLGSRYVIEGNLQRAGARLRLTVQLIDASDGMHVWSLLFDVSGDDVFSVEDRVAQRVARALRHSVVQTVPAAMPVGTVIQAGR